MSRAPLLEPNPPRLSSSIRQAGWGWRGQGAAALVLLPIIAIACGDGTSPPPPPASVVFTVQPSNVASGAAIAPPVQVAVRDASGNVVRSATTPVTLELLGPTEGTLLGTATATPVNGIATFSNLSIGKAASYQLVARFESLSATSASFTVSPGAPAKLAFIAQPTTVVGYKQTTDEFQVAIQDAFGNTVVTATDTVNIALGANPGGANLTGPSIEGAFNGIVRLRGLRLDAPGNGYTLTVSRPGLTGATSAPFSVTAPPPYTAIATAAFHACGIISGEGLHCWGINDVGQLGIGIIGARAVATPVIGGTQFVSVSLGFLYTSCGLNAAGSAFCWGRNAFGMLGDGTTADRSAPVAVAGGHTFASIAAGGAHGCGLKADGSAYCWGYNDDGAVGDGTNAHRTTPVAVAGGLQFASIAAGDFHNCGLIAGGAAFCWGSNDLGQLGDGTTVDRATPTPVAGGFTFATISPGNAHTCALTVSGTAYCWGANNLGQLGDGTQTSQLTPVAVSGGLAFQSISSGSSHTCGLVADGDAYCWGNNFGGKLGDGTLELRLTPTRVGGGLKFVTVSAGASLSCGIAVSGAAYCWGGGEHGQIGNGSFGSSLLPARVLR